ncbi:response regulator transcription factor [Phenylobacterium sp.]|jgi:two-component system response regulator FixJ|uniref:response regulator transcription factor n=1 Tax=Phenylobacterium sp. TaxID=1871053 RepID=UPI002F400CEE
MAYSNIVPSTNSREKTAIFTIGCAKGFVDSLMLWGREHWVSIQSYEDPEAFLRDASGLPYGCVVVEQALGDRRGVDLLRRLRHDGLAFEVILIAAEAESDVALAVEAMKEGAREVLREPVVPEALLVLAEGVLRARSRPAADNPIHRLTLREREVLKAIVDGETNRQIAQALGISARTVEFHRSSLMAKMGAASTAALVRLALASWSR